ncbi:hypothetical protein FN846DRAFT_933093 [Sphaerosporella brunnea]|uniref:Uncharacterized protein n=1 Tax=Sphaerosporella brunnea TaxID=1250544 RepID=A0A5J5F6H7_9PEZI|nr:hypothetical protein FN846DRAFT_933093 [Sphaerosporella brunnea]
MDEAYDSPDSDGHASIPSPTETSFNMSTLHDARPWPPASPSPSPGTTSDDEEEDDQPVVVVRRNFKSGAVPMLPSILDSSPPASRILKPTSVNDSVSSTPKHPRKRSFENLPKKSAEMTSDGESTAGETTEIAGAPGPSNATTDEADSYALPSPGPSPLLSPHPSSTPDPRTGLTKRINLRKNWSSPIKETQERSVSLSGEPVLPLRYDGGDEDESIEVPMIKRPSSAPYLSTEQHAEDSAGRPRPMLPEYTPERPLSAGSRPQTQRLPRAMSELSIASLTRHESFEEIDAAFVREKLSQAFESARPQRSSEQNRKASHPDKSFEKEPEAVSKISGDPQTPQNNGASRRKYLPTNILNFSLKRDIASTSQITPDRAALFATGSGTRGILETPAGMTSSPPGSPGPRYTEEADLPEGEGDSEYAVSRTMEESHDSLSPQHPYHGFSPWKFNNSKPVRRVSIGSPPAASPMSATDSPFFRRGPTSPDLQTSKHNRRGKLGSVVIFEDNQPQEGMIPPVNTPTTRNARRPHVDHDKARMRERSRSDPLDLRGDDGIISVPSTVNSVRKVDKSAPDLAQGITEDSHIQDTQEGSSTVEGSPPCDSPDGQRVLEVRSSRSSSSVGNPEEEPTSKDAVNNRYTIHPVSSTPDNLC